MDITVFVDVERNPGPTTVLDHTYKHPAVGLAHVRIKWWIHHHKPLAHESYQLRRLPHGKISLAPYDDNSLNLVLSLSNVVKLETARNR